MMNDEVKKTAFHSSFIIPPSALLFKGVFFMRIVVTLVLTGALLLIGACNASRNESQPSTAGKSTAPAQPNREQTAEQTSVPKLSTVTANQSDSSPVEVNRKIIRNAEITLESTDPEEGLRKIASIAEARGGFVVTSEVKQEGSAASGAAKTATVVARVPAAQFEAAIEEIRKAGSRILHEKRTGQDVTEEFIDLEARIRTKRALEAQFLEIMKQAQKVSEALEVQRQLADVRTEIEQLEGRRRFLENQSSLSTITVKIEPPVSIVAATPGGFFSEAKRAVSDGLEIAVAITLGFISFALALLPILLFIVLPLVLLARFLMRRNKGRGDLK
jgi:Domain of unknown function (DUF4349)